MTPREHVVADRIEIVVYVALALILLVADFARAEPGSDGGFRTWSRTPSAESSSKPDGGVVLDGSAVVTTDAGVVLMPSAVCLDETAAVRVARELASRRAIEPVLRETPVVPVTPTTIVVTNAVSIALGVVLGAWGGVTACRELPPLCR